MKHFNAFRRHIFSIPGIKKIYTETRLQELWSSTIILLTSFSTAKRFREMCRSKFADYQHDYQIKLFKDRQIQVLSGPFRGMKYFNEIVWGPIMPKWLGSYEVQLHPVIENSLRPHYDQIIDVGAAEGYYAIGMARLFPDSRLTTYDTDPFARAAQKRLCRLNGVNNVTVKWLCNSRILGRQIGSLSTLLIIDVEGYELTLLDPLKCRGLRDVDIIVELHATQDIQIDEAAHFFSSRFESTHVLQHIEPFQGSPEYWRSRIPALKEFTDDEITAAVCEHRGNKINQWMFMKSKTLHLQSK